MRKLLAGIFLLVFIGSLFFLKFTSTSQPTVPPTQPPENPAVPQIVVGSSPPSLEQIWTYCGIGGFVDPNKFPNAAAARTKSPRRCCNGHCLGRTLPPNG